MKELLNKFHAALGTMNAGAVEQPNGLLSEIGNYSALCILDERLVFNLSTLLDEVPAHLALNGMADCGSHANTMPDTVPKMQVMDVAHRLPRLLLDTE